MTAFIRLMVYLGMGALAHWLWIGEHVDPQNVFTWVCLLIGPIMTLAWLIKTGAWWLLALSAASITCVGFVLSMDALRTKIHRARRLRERAAGR